MGTPGFDWGICSFCDNGDRNALFDCRVLRAQVQSLADPGIIWIGREIVQRDDCMAASLCPLATQLGTSCNTVSIGSRKDWDEYLQKRLGKITSISPSSIVIEDIIESPTDLESSDSRKGQTPPAIKGFTPLVLALPTIIGPASSSVQEGTTIAPTIRSLDPLILPRPTFGISRNGRCYTPEELEKRRKEIRKSTVKPIRNRATTEEAKEFLKIIKNLEYTLLLSSDVHCEALLKVLKETCVPTGVIESSFKGMVSMVLATNQISFTDDELAPEGRKHTLPMNIVVKCEDMIVSRVLIDNGLALNVCLMSTIKPLNVDTSLIRLTTMIIRALNGTLQEVQGYDPSDKELFWASRGKKRKYTGQGMSIPHIRVTFPTLAEVIKSEMAQESCEEESDLACLIGLCPEEFLVNAIISLGMI
ncbi:hypothetical protein SO802_010162 [Lithocarpus litseifolius]|uniref:Uncharacterized protein n=1 Tax=Lithocarpus litseifolius TaxID=425828 RepID=A0AAW2DHC5_9ROSI